jgi:hypothetical protein
MRNAEEIRERLLRLDEDAALLFDGSDRFVCIIVGGSALILLGYISRATHDIDFLRTPPVLQDLLQKYDMNARVSAYMTNFPDDYGDRIQKIDLDTQIIDFYTLSLEDLIVSKLAAGRPKDLEDVSSPDVIKHIDWGKLEKCAEMVKIGMLSERDIAGFDYFYANFKERFHP